MFLIVYQNVTISDIWVVGGQITVSTFWTSLNMAIRTFKIIYMVWTAFLLDSTGLKAEMLL